MQTFDAFFIIQHSYSGKAADIWALGATLFALVFGNVPFSATNVPAVYEKIKHDELEFPSTVSISDDLLDLIKKMLDKDPSKRITLPQIKVCFLGLKNFNGKNANDNNTKLGTYLGHNRRKNAITIGRRQLSSRSN